MNNKRNGGLARAKALTAQQRSEIGKKGAKKREENKNLPIATHIGELKIDETILDVSVLSDDRRIISQSSVFKA
jgi:molybdopterin synthase catalytic subunit